MITDMINALMQNPVFAGIFGAGLTGVALMALRSLPSLALRGLWRSISCTIEVVEGEETFQWLDTWLSRHPYAKRAKNLRFVGGEYRPYTDREGPLARLSPGIGLHFFRHGHMLVFLSKSRESNGSGDSRKPREMISMTIVGGGRSAISEIIQEAEKSAEQLPDHFQIMSTGYDGWYNSGTRRKRALSSVVLPPGMKERLTDDIELFLSRQDWYRQRGIPYRRGYAFVGPPGCGKSSAIGAIAATFFSRVHILSLASVKSDKDLLDMMTQVKSNAAVVIEDIDTVFHGREMIASQLGGALTFGGLLNALDGIGTSEGLVVFISANHPDHLDEALIRPGRIDVLEKFGLACHEQAAGLFLNFFPARADMADRFAVAAVNGGLSTAAIQGVLIQHSEDPVAAITNVERFVVSLRAAALSTTETTGEGSDDGQHERANS